MWYFESHIFKRFHTSTRTLCVIFCFRSRQCLLNSVAVLDVALEVRSCNNNINVELETVKLGEDFYTKILLEEQHARQLKNREQTHPQNSRHKVKFLRTLSFTMVFYI